MNRLDSAIHRRTIARLAVARDRSARIVDDADEIGVSISIVGSLAKGSFKAHSDIDFVVHGTTEPARRAMVERLVADRMRGSDIPYDIIFEADISPERVRELLDVSF